MPRLSTITFLALLPLAACNSNPTNPMASTVPTPMPSVPSTTAQDQAFATQAASSDAFEIQSSQLALQKSRNPAIRRFASQMVEAHTATSQKLAVLASQKGISLPGGMDTMLQQRLTTLEGANRGFDRAYIAAQISGHRDAAQVFRTEISSGTDPDLKMAAQNTLPMIEQHMAMAQRLR